MDVRIDKGRLSIHIVDLLSSLTMEEKRSVIDTLSCDDEIITDVTAQLLDGWTEGGSYGGKIDGQADPSTPLSKAKREIALRSGEVAKKEIEDLCASLRWTKANEERYMEWGFRMYHGDGMSMPIPPLIKYDESLQYEVVKKDRIF